MCLESDERDWYMYYTEHFKQQFNKQVNVKHYRQRTICIEMFIFLTTNVSTLQAIQPIIWRHLLDKCCTAVLKILHCSCRSDVGEFSRIIMHFQTGSDLLINPFLYLLLSLRFYRVLVVVMKYFIIKYKKKKVYSLLSFSMPDLKMTSYFHKCGNSYSV